MLFINFQSRFAVKTEYVLKDHFNMIGNFESLLTSAYYGHKF